MHGEPVRGERVAQPSPVVRAAGELVGERGGQPQADAEGVEPGGLPDGAGVPVELGEHAVQVLGGVDVGAVRQRHAGHARTPRSTEEPSNSAGAGASPGTKPGTGSRTRLPDWA